MIKIYTDGACSPNPGKGGWAACFYYNNERFECFGFKDSSTNNEMELTAVVEGLKLFRSLNIDEPIQVLSDSGYVINTLTKGWNRNANLFLWQEIDKLQKVLTIEWVWVKGHSTDLMNNYVDSLAVRARKEDICSNNLVDTEDLLDLPEVDYKARYIALKKKIQELLEFIKD